MRILVTGGAGYIGSVSVEAFVQAGHDVVVLDDLSTGHRGAVSERVALEIGSYGETDAVVALLRRHRIDAVLHCAAKSIVGESMTDPAKYFRENVVGGIALLEGMRTAGVRRIVFSSTAATYGMPERTPIAESDPVRPINTYGETKRDIEGAIAWYGHGYGFRSVILRYFNAAGASARNGELHSPETHLIPNVLAAAEEGRELTLFGDDYPTPDGTCVRDYIHVEDLAAAHLLAVLATDPADLRTGPPTGPCESLICNLGSGTGFSNRQVVAAAEAVVGHGIAVRIGPRRAATRRYSSPAPSVPRRSCTGGPVAARSTRSSARRGRGARRTQRVTPTRRRRIRPCPSCAGRPRPHLSHPNTPNSGVHSDSGEAVVPSAIR